MSVLTKTLLKFGDAVTAGARKNLKSRGKNSTNKLSKSLSVGVTESSSATTLEFSMEEYGMGVDAGRHGSTKKATNKGSLFNISRSGQPPVSEIKRWAAKKPVKPKRGYSVDSTAYVIAKSIGKKGFKGSMFFTDAFNSNSKNLSRIIEDAIAEDMLLQINKTIKT